MSGLRSTLLLLAAVAAMLAAGVSGADQPSPYLQVYPPVNETDDRTPLYVALSLSFGGDYVSIGALPGVQIALDYINSERDLLPGYTLHYTLTDSQCNRTRAFKNFHTAINFAPTKIGWIGSGCSVATEPNAALTQYYNITHVSCVSSSAELRNRQRYRYYFQMVATEVLVAEGFYGIIKNFGWKRVGIISQDERVFTETVDILENSLSAIDVEVIDKRFGSDEGIGSIAELFEPGIRIYVLTMYSPHARNILCEAYKRRLFYPKYMFITYGWYVDGWWKDSNDGNCTGDELADMLLYTMGPIIREIPDDDVIGEPGISVKDFKSQYLELQRGVNKDIGIDDHEEVFDYTYHCHEGALAFAYALNKTIAELAENETLNREAARLSGLSDGETFTMANFTYANSAVVSRMFEHMESTMFPGLSGNPVRFTADGVRDIDTVSIRQYQRNPSDGSLLTHEVATVSGANKTFNRVSNITFPDGPPSDGVPIREVVEVALPLTVIYIILAFAGISFSLVCLFFTLFFKNKKLIRLSSPNLNLIIALGAIVLYMNVVVLVIPTMDPDLAAVICNINPWLTSLGYSLCYGTILIKMFRVWLIFNKPLGLKASLLQDYTMALFVLCLVVIDIVILGAYTVTEAVRGNLGVRETFNREGGIVTVGPRAEIHHHLIYICESEGQVALYAVLYGYKGLLTAIALLLAFRTRKVKVKGLDDSKYIAASIYVTSIVLAVIIVSTYTLRDYLNSYPAVVGMGLILGTTVILGLVFVPRMIELYKDPEGDNINIKSSTIDRGSEKEVIELRKRINELEKSLKQRASFSSANPDSIAHEPNSVEHPEERHTGPKTEDQQKTNGSHINNHFKNSNQETKQNVH